MPFLRKYAIFLKPEKIFRLSAKITNYLKFLAPMVLIISLIVALFTTPKDLVQGDVYRIIYIHVPCAMLSMSIFLIMTICSTIYLIWRIKLYDHIQQACAELGTMFTLLALVTGSIWGKPTWGTWWVWDARLSSEFMLLCIYLGIILLRNSVRTKRQAAIVCSAVTIIGSIDIPIIHFSVTWWHTLHQGATVTKLAMPSIDASMLYPLIGSIFALYLVFIWLLLEKLQNIMLSNRLVI